MSASRRMLWPACISTARGRVRAMSLISGNTRLVYVERHEQIEQALAREKLVKKWRREWKFELIEADNPEWDDLWERWFALPPEQK